MTASKEIKWLGTNLTKVKDMCTENFKNIFKGIKEALNRWEDILCSWIRRFNVVKMAIFP